MQGKQHFIQTADFQIKRTRVSTMEATYFGNTGRCFQRFFFGTPQKYVRTKKKFNASKDCQNHQNYDGDNDDDDDDDDDEW